MLVPGFDLVPMLIGRGGQNMRKIANATGAKIRVRGRGSGHLEIDGQREAPTPLMVAVTTEKKDSHGFRAAVEMTLHELRIVDGRFKAFCEKENISHEGPTYSIGLLTEGAEEMLGEAINGVAVALGGATLSRGRANGNNGSRGGERMGARSINGSRT